MMTDDTLKDLVLKHDHTIETLVSSVDQLVASNTETNNRLADISKYLAKQSVFDTRLSAMDRELEDSFRQVHARIDTLDVVQSSEHGCKSVQLLNKDVQSISKDTLRIVESLENTQEKLEITSKRLDEIPSQKIMQWVVGIVIIYLISFGSYVVTSIHTNEVAITKIMEHISK